MNNPTVPTEEEVRRKQLRSLRIVLVLSMIGSGTNVLSSLTSALFLPAMNSLYEAGQLPIPDYMQVAVEAFLNMPRMYFFITFVLAALSLTGVILMWKPRRSGFHFYTLAQLLLIVVALLFLGRTGIQLGDVMLTLLFIAFYYFSLRSLGVLSSEKNNTTAEENSSAGNNPNEQ